MQEKYAETGTQEPEDKNNDKIEVNRSLHCKHTIKSTKKMKGRTHGRFRLNWDERERGKGEKALTTESIKNLNCSLPFSSLLPTSPPP